MDPKFIEAMLPDAIAASYFARLMTDGYCIVPNAINPQVGERANCELESRFGQTPFCKGVFYGETTKRFGALLNRSEAVRSLVLNPLVLKLVQGALGPHCDRFNLNLTQAIEIHPGAPMQLPHRDQAMWGGPKGELEYLVNVMWPLTPFTKENGATVVWPGSHREQDKLALPEEDSVVASMEPGSVLLFLGSTLHAGGANRSNAPRRGILISYCLGWLRQFEAQTLIYPPAIAREFPTELSELIGYSIHRPNLGNYEGQSPAILLGNDVPDFLQSQDALTPEQQAAIAQLGPGNDPTQATQPTRRHDAQAAA
jgi:ectoine hydroxylase-related dioxygenase (phytanoyl-CoA dioxygenase family)